MVSQNTTSISILCAKGKKMKKKALFLDRDGVINLMIKKKSRFYNKIMDDTPFKLEELKLNKGIKGLVKTAKEKGYLPIVVTNQPSIAKGDSTKEEYEKITSKICKYLDIKRSQVFECLHRPPITEECSCRKPKPGLFFMAKKLHNISLKDSIMIGDSSSDIEAAKNAGVGKFFYLRRRKSEKQIGNEKDELLMKKKGIIPTKIFNSLEEIEKEISLFRIPPMSNAIL